MTSTTIAGELESTPFAHFLVYAMDRSLTGALFLDDPSGREHVVSFAKGAPVKVRPGDGYARLGEMLIDAGAITEPVLQGALSVHSLLGDALLVGGFVDHTTLESVAETQFVKRMVRLFGLPAETTYRYVDGHEELAEWGGEPAAVDPLALLWAGLREYAHLSSMMEGTLHRLGDSPARIHTCAVLDRFAFESPELEAIGRMKESAASLPDLVACGVAPAETLRRLLYTLLITRQLDLGQDTLPVGSPGAEASPASYASPSLRVALGRMQLRTITHRAGAAAPDLPGEGEPSSSIPRPRRP